MAKTIVTFKGKCANATKNANGSSVQLANQITQTDKGPGAREVVVINVVDQAVANFFEVMNRDGAGKTYTVTVTEE